MAPGFVDIHNHTDTDIERLPLAQNYMQPGVTTIVGGNCGDSIYPVGEKLAALERLCLGINFAMLVGQATIRKQVMGMVGRAPALKFWDACRWVYSSLGLNYLIKILVRFEEVKLQACVFPQKCDYSRIFDNRIGSINITHLALHH